MPHTCRRCGYSTERQDNFMNHLKRVRPCPPLLSSITGEQQIQDIREASRGPIVYRCDHCDKPYNSRQGKYLHKRKCTVRRDSNPNEEEKEPQTSSSSTSPIFTATNHGSINATVNSNNNNTTTTTNNTTNHIVIQLRPFGEENIDYLLEGENPMIRDILNDRNAFMQNLVKAIHFNEAHPENMNVYITYLRGKHIITYDGKLFEANLRDPMLDKMWKGKSKLLRDNIENIGVSSETMKYILDKLEVLSVDKEKQDILKEKLELICYNKRNMVIANKEKCVGVSGSAHADEDEF